LSNEQTGKPGGERRYQRARCDFPAEFSWGTITNSARVLIISLGGAFLETEVFVPAGEEMEVSLSFDSESAPIVCRAAVVWVADPGVKVKGPKPRPGFAVEFMKIFPEHRALIDEYVRKQNRIFRAIHHELDKAKPDKALIKELFARVCPQDSTHLNHIKKVCKEEMKFFRLRP